MSRPSHFCLIQLTKLDDGRFGLLVAAMTSLALVLRIVTFTRSWSQIDEPASLLAIEMVASTGIPLFPSDVLYLQGSLFSYLAAPLAWFLDGNALLNAAQLFSLAIAIMLVPITMVYTRYVTSSLLATSMSGFFIACDPNLIAWSVVIRPYGFLAVATVLTLYSFTRILVEGNRVRIGGIRGVVWLPIFGIIGTFTHIGFWLIAPGLVVIAIAYWRKTLLTSNRIILICGLTSLAAPIAFLLLGTLVGVGNGTGGEDQSGSILGSHLFSFDRLIDAPTLRWSTWTRNFVGGWLDSVLPLIIIVCSVVLILRLRNEASIITGRATTTLLAAHWSMILIVIVFVVFDSQPRYLIHALPLGYIAIGWATSLLWQSARTQAKGSRMVIRTILALLIIATTFANSATAGAWQMNRPGYDADYWEITSWVSDHYEDGQVIITSLPPASWFWFPKSTIEDDIYFLAGPEGSARSRRYIKTTADGETSEYWLGIPPITSVQSLCTMLKDGAGNAWIITDVTRLSASWAYKGEMAELILATTLVLHQNADGSQARFVRPIVDWDLSVTAACIFLNTR